MSILGFDAVTKTYRTRSAAVLAVDGVTFRVEEGETVGLVGESGSGKSTIARIAVGLLKPSSGSVIAFGERVDQLPERRLRPLRRRFGFVFQDPYASLNPRQQVSTVLELPFRLHTRLSGAERRREILRLLERVGLTPPERFVTSLPHQLSGGQRQRVAIARAIALRPGLLIADEPVSSLDVSVAGQILNLLRDVRDEMGSSTVLISHDLALIRAMCDRVLVMHRGRIVEEGPSESVLQRPAHAYTQQLLASMPERLVETGLQLEEERHDR
jgi:peptide/nickel transport system ATP-binding protein